MFELSRAYRFYYAGKYDFAKYDGHIKTPPLQSQADRRFYFRIAQKLNDDQIHALFTIGFFHKPKAYVADLSTPEAFTAAMIFAGRPENGRTLLERELYDLSKVLRQTDIDTWLYGERIDGQRASTPECMRMIMSGELAPDVACLLLLIPQPALQYAWMPYQEARPEATFGLGIGPWLQRLRLIDQLILRQRPGWRMLSHDLAKAFWKAMRYPTLAPHYDVQPAALFA